MRSESDVFPDVLTSSPFPAFDLPGASEFSDPSPSSPLKCCPTAWIFPAEVPTSSSPPNRSDSSPLSDFSKGNGDESSSNTSRSSSTSCDLGAYEHEDFNNSVAGHQHASSSSSTFGRRLHDLLLVVARERASVVAGGLSQVSGRAVSPLFSSPSLPPDEEKIHSQHDSKVAIAASRSPEKNHFSIEPRFRPSPLTQNKSFSFSSTSSLTSLSDDSSQASSHSDLHTPPRRQVSGQASQENTGHRSTRLPLPRASAGSFLQQRYTSFPRLTDPPAQYRVIKRPQSFLADKLRNAAGEPMNKRPKTLTNSGNVQARHRAYAPRSASLRRAASLRSDRTPTAYPCVPTVPATPQVDPATASRHKREDYCSPECLPQGVPIIAPPSNHVARFSLSAETIAKIRLGKYLAREGMGRVRDGLPTGICQDDGTYDCCISVLPREQDNSDSDKESGNDGEREKQRTGRAQCRNAKRFSMASRREWEMMLDLGEDFRKEVIIWILEVLPDLHDDGSITSSGSSSRHSSFTSTSRKSYISSNLLDQLISSPETRFHAGWMFLRYFFLIMAPESAIWLDPVNGSTSVIASKKKSYPEDMGRMPIIWDIAVGCLALSVKFHRDFLEPLFPVFAFEFCDLAPHRMAYEDLETAQRDIFSAFSYSLGVTPQPIIDELWIALPSLRYLLDFRGAWNFTQKETWWRLFQAICEADVMRFPISLLTSTALADAIVTCLEKKYEYEATWDSSVARHRFAGRRPHRDGLESEQETRTRKWTKLARREADGVIQDIQALVGITDDQLRVCRAWFANLDAR